MLTTVQKDKKLGEILANMQRVLVAFSGGVDSTFLLVRAKEEVGKENVLAVIAKSDTFPKREFDQAIQFVEEHAIPYEVVTVDEFSDNNFVANSKKRCYFCKTGLFSEIKSLAEVRNYPYVIDGSNYSDLNDFRPGMTALREQKVSSPLQEACLTKDDIRQLSKQRQLKTWNKPSFACLSSRIPYGTEITVEKIKQLDESESFLYSLGFNQLRVRHHGTIARIEVEPSEFQRVLDYRKEIDWKFRELGFQYVAMDLLGYRSGSMNETLLETVVD